MSIKKKEINDNNTYNALPLNEDNNSIHNFDIVKKNTNYQKVYLHDEKGQEKKNVRTNRLKENKIEKNRINNRSVNLRDKRHIKNRSMKLEDFYGLKGKKKDSKNIYISTNGN